MRIDLTLADLLSIVLLKSLSSVFRHFGGIVCGGFFYVFCSHWEDAFLLQDHTINGHPKTQFSFLFTQIVFTGFKGLPNIVTLLLETNRREQVLIMILLILFDIIILFIHLSFQKCPSE